MIKFQFITGLLLLLLISNSRAQEKKAINNSYIAFTIPEKDLLPENVAFDPQTESFFVGSTRKGKVLRVKDGKIEEFIKPKAHGLWMTIGMKVDSQRRILWVNSSGGSNLEGYTKKDDVDGRPAGVFKFNLDTGELIQKYTMETKGEVHFLNDLVVARNGDVYVTHTFGEPAIYKIANGSDELELFVKDEIIMYPNGITIADNQRVLFVAHAEGLARIDIPDKKVTALSVPEGVKVSRRESMDGLYYYKWSLIGMQSDLATINRYYLNDEGDGIDRVEVVEKNHPMMDYPTTGAIIGSTFYYIANSQFPRISDDGVLIPMDQLYEPVVLKVELE
ncbi:MAG: hypothetical protein JJ971_15605 [Balneolaceae bacterium]|nr:hypothetical protein [Balneolaceae bacterium]MBO6547826.1 hypothetical protein [Balneolaceae bacterium]MBO6648337.1 hypothetical protein [Balneolaceae bacterium]